jgi:regulator of protease activity HflC (stomatin/prohibitin superfamily)
MNSETEIARLQARAEKAETDAEDQAKWAKSYLDRAEKAEAERDRYRAVLEKIASGKYSGFMLASNPPQDPIIFAAQCALGGAK